jgi:phosphatidylserine/phosphatidylglycerophosphate/cardiolipin synthase-like enzyme
MSKNSKNSSRRSLGGTLLGLLVIIIAFFFAQATGIDILALLNDVAGEVEEVDQTGSGGSDDFDTAPPTLSLPGEVTPLQVGQGFGAQKGFWSVYFNAPTGSRDAADYVNGIDENLAADINNVQQTLDIAAFEFNNERLTEAVIAAHERGVQVRIVTDDEFGVEEEEAIEEFEDAGIPVVDDAKSALMHNKFMILDQQVVWTGSWNYTVNGTYRNNNNALVLRSQRAVRAYQTEFDEMFERGEFGARSTEGTATFSQDGTPVKIVFAPEDDVVGAIVEELGRAQRDIRFMAFSFTQDDIGDAMRQLGAEEVTVQGIFEVRGSETEFSEMPPMYCAGFDVRQDGNPFALHHKVIIVDDTTVLTGSFNFSANATESNDENLVIIRDPDLAALYLTEYERRFAEASPPDPADIECE